MLDRKGRAWEKSARSDRSARNDSHGTIRTELVAPAPESPERSPKMEWRDRPGRADMSTTRDLDQVTYTRLGILLIVIGGILAAGMKLKLPAVYKLWPILTLSLGVGFVGIYVKRRGRGSIYLVLGEYLILFSGLAFYLNFSTGPEGPDDGSGWGNLAHLWPLFMAFLAVVFGTLFIVGRRRRLVLFLALLLLVGTVFSFLVLSHGREFWWTAFIFAGLSVLVSGKSK
jgi:hypothetical protein